MTKINYSVLTIYHSYFVGVLFSITLLIPNITNAQNNIQKRIDGIYDTKKNWDLFFTNTYYQIIKANI